MRDESSILVIKVLSFTAVTSSLPDVTVVIPHRDTANWLLTSIGLWLHQDTRPLILVTDTGSKEIESDCALAQLSGSSHVEVAKLNIGETDHPSDNIAHAMDYAFSRCRTPFLLATHVDVFPKRKDLITMLQALCTAESPVVGWEMSPRGPGPDGVYTGTVSRGYPGHCCTLFHMETMDRIGAGWSLRRSAHVFGSLRTHHPYIDGWPDTETCLGNLLMSHGITPKFLGRETNNVNQETRYWTHARSRTNRGETPRHRRAHERAAVRLRRWDQDGHTSAFPRRNAHPRAHRRAGVPSPDGNQAPRTMASEILTSLDREIEERIDRCPYRYPLDNAVSCGLLRSCFRDSSTASLTVHPDLCRRCAHHKTRPTEHSLNSVLWQQLALFSRQLLKSPQTPLPTKTRAKLIASQATKKILEAKAARMAYSPQS